MGERCLFIMMNGKGYDLWRAVDADGMALDILVQERRNHEAAETFRIKGSTIGRGTLIGFVGTC
jgi:hypothetical protein